MTSRCLAVSLTVVALVVFAPVSSAAQADVPRTAWGQPDLQGVWDFRTVTPLERPAQFGDRETLTEEEAAAVEAGAAVFQQFIDRPPPEGSVGAYNAFWLDFGTTVGEDRRSSLIVEPANGRLPALADGVATQVGSLDEDLPGEYPWRVRSAGLGADGPEDRGLAERCLLGFNAGPPMMPSAYNNNMQLFQTADHVVILNEMIHNARIIPVGDSPHVDTDIRQWEGDPRGHWEGNTLIVESTNFRAVQNIRGPSAGIRSRQSEAQRIVERFSLVGPDMLRYSVTMDDAETYTAPWSAAFPFNRDDDYLQFEYACHEGNHAMINVLRGARAQETEATPNR